MLYIEPIWYYGERKYPYGYCIRDDRDHKRNLSMSYDVWTQIEALSPEEKERYFQQIMDEPDTIKIDSFSITLLAENQNTR